MAEGEDVGVELGENMDSGRAKSGGMGDEAYECGWRHSGVDCTDPYAPEYEGVCAGLGMPRGDGMLMAAVILNEGCGEGPRGRRDLVDSPLKWSRAAWRVEVECDMVEVDGSAVQLDVMFCRSGAELANGKARLAEMI